MKKKKSVLSVVGLVVLYLGAQAFGIDLSSLTKSDSNSAPATSSNKVSQPASTDHSAINNEAIYELVRQRRSDTQVKGVGIVKRVLPDDNEGSRHQRLIVDIGNQQTILIAHNIDLAPRVPNISRGDRIEFYGEYEYTEQGGVVHWTHHDPGKRHIDGWLKFNGKKYE